MRVATKINLAILSTIVCAVVLVLGNLFILSEQFKGLEQSQKAQSITRLSSSLLVLTQEYVLFKSPSVADAWLRTHRHGCVWTTGMPVADVTYKNGPFAHLTDCDCRVIH